MRSGARRVSQGSTSYCSSGGNGGLWYGSAQSTGPAGLPRGRRTNAEKARPGRSMRCTLPRSGRSVKRSTGPRAASRLHAILPDGASRTILAGCGERGRQSPPAEPMLQGECARLAVRRIRPANRLSLSFQNKLHLVALWINDGHAVLCGKVFVALQFRHLLHHRVGEGLDIRSTWDAGALR